MITVGCDPEVLLVNKNNKFISSVDLLGGKKINPRKTTNGWIQEDNVLAEYNIPPAKTADEFVNFNRLVLRDLEDIIKPYGLSWVAQASAEYDDDQLDSFQAILAGCEPDYCGWTDSVNNPPDLTGNLRSAGGHLHVAWEVDKVSRKEMIQSMDCLLGLPSVLMDKDNRRRTLYGKAGAHRPKFLEQGHPYNGAEYRVLSNFWLKSDETMRWAFNQTVEAFNRAKEISQLLQARIIEAEEIIGAINTGNGVVAGQLCDFLNIRMVA